MKKVILIVLILLLILAGTDTSLQQDENLGYKVSRSRFAFITYSKVETKPLISQWIERTLKVTDRGRYVTYNRKTLFSHTVSSSPSKIRYMKRYKQLYEESAEPIRNELIKFIRQGYYGFDEGFSDKETIELHKKYQEMLNGRS